MNNTQQYKAQPPPSLQAVSCRLPHGLEVTMRRLTSEDSKHFHAGMQALSARSRYHRFNTYRSKLTDAQIKYLTEIDQVNHVALCVSCTTETEEIGIGVGRFVRQPADKHSAELALTVIDAYQHQGVGTLLMAALCKLASQQDISTFTLRIHASRFALIQRLAALDARVVSHQQGVLEMELPVVNDDILRLNSGPQIYQAYQAFSA